VPCLARSDWQREQRRSTVGSTIDSCPSECIVLCRRFSSERWEPITFSARLRVRSQVIGVEDRGLRESHSVLVAVFQGFPESCCVSRDSIGHLKAGDKPSVEPLRCLLM